MEAGQRAAPMLSILNGVLNAFGEAIFNLNNNLEPKEVAHKFQEKYLKNIPDALREIIQSNEEDKR